MPVRTKEFYEKMNRVIERLGLTYLSKNESKYIWVLFRKTFAYGKYRDKISRFQMASLTGILEVNVSSIQTRLKERNIIIVNSKYKGFNLNTDEWEKVSLPIPFQKVSLPILKGIATNTKKVSLPIPYKETNKETTQRREDFYKKLSRKEIEKLELEKWYQAVMWNYGRFSKEYIESTIRGYDYDTRMSCWYIYEDSGNIRDKEAFFSHLLRNYKEDLKERN